MRLSKILAIHAAMMAILGCSLASGQTTVPSARFRPVPAESPNATDPFVQPGAFDYDAQMFAPYDLRDLAEPEGPVGFYFAYDRVYTSISNPGVHPSDFPEDDIFVPTGNNYIWGNRFEAGVMNCDGTGWGGVYTRAAGMFFSAGQDILVPNPFLTLTSVNNLELNRMFRQDLQRGGWLEPYFGFRFVGINDNTIEDTSIGASFNRFTQNATNNCWGAHVGARHARRFGRWGFATDGSLGATYNTQSYVAQDLTTTGNTLAITETYSENSSFSPLIDLRADLSYAITRDLALRLGAQVLYLWDGVNRANTLPTPFNPNSVFGPGGPTDITTESFVQAGFTFGIDWKR